MLPTLSDSFIREVAPSRERELKYTVYDVKGEYCLVAPSRERELKCDPAPPRA